MPVRRPPSPTADRPGRPIARPKGPPSARSTARLAWSLFLVGAGAALASAQRSPPAAPSTAGSAPSRQAFPMAPAEQVLGRSGEATAPLQVGSVQRALALLGAEIVAADGTKVGPLENIALDAGHETALFALASAGKWVAREDRLYPLPLEALSARPGDAAGGPKLLLQHVSRAMLAMVPEAERVDWPSDDGPMDAALWSAAVWQHYGMKPYWNTLIPEEPRPTTDRQGRPLVPPPPPPKPFHKNGSDLAFLRLRTILGADVVSAASDDRLGRLVDLLFDLSRSRIVAGIVAREDGEGHEALVPVPWAALETRAAGTRFALPVEVPAWRAAPGFAPDAWPSLGDSDWDRLGRATLAAKP